MNEAEVTARLRHPRFAPVAKEVRFATGFRDYSGRVTVGSAYDADFDTLIERLRRGAPLPARFYRSGIDRDADELLADAGIKHLHLGGQRSDVLVFLVEYDDVVMLLEINDHKHFRTDPPGTLLRALHGGLLTSEDAAAERRRAARAAARRLAVRTGLKPRRPG